MVSKECFGCEKVTSHEHLHDCAPGIPETHMVGSERLKRARRALRGYTRHRAAGARRHGPVALSCATALNTMGGGQGILSCIGRARLAEM
jgi:hypothetical protein